MNDTPAPQDLGNGIYQIPVPLPFRSPPFVNTYVVESSDGLLVLDVGSDWEEGRSALTSGFTCLGLPESAVHTMMVSHLHLDHVGMAGRMIDSWGCDFVMHERASQLVDGYNDTPGYVKRLRDLGHTHGVPHTILDTLSDFQRPEYMPKIPKPSRTVVDGQRIDLGANRSLTVVHTPGHEPSHICLVDSRTGVTFSGDHVLPRISPVIMYDGTLDDPLGEYLSSLQKLINMEIGITYPAHGSIVEQGDERARQILLHHDRRLLDMAELVRSADANAWEVMVQSFRPNLDPLQARLAFLETISHLEHLRLTGRIQYVDRGGITFYGR
ncbi:MAG: MBL fold metallo-hydrolase [Acidimicrobiia bacterium]|nr:MBL fold metallo-hydrolase [Acidimicrobiia bacterium]MDH3463757.1 MBL fold metallo-hydrolase [Acidimicrobiia bacterium]